MLALGALVLPLTVILFGVDLATAGPALGLVIGLGAVGVAAVGTLYAGPTVRPGP